MRVYFVSSGLQGCYVVRCLLPLQANGWDGDQTSMRLESRTPENKAKAAMDAEIVVFHRPDSPKKLELARMLKKAGKKIVFDNDDTFKDDGGFKFNEYMDKARLEHGLKKMNHALDTFIQEADLVTCSTELLKEEYLKLNPNVKVLPNCIDPDYFDEPLKNETGIVRIGITGSIAITSDIDRTKAIVEKYHQDPRVRIVLFSMPPRLSDKITRELYWDEYRFWESVDVEWHPFVDMEDYYDKLNELRIDIMLAPRGDNHFNRCKSNLKFLESSMFEIPMIAQGFPDGKSPYQDPEDARHMIITEDNWFEEIEKLIANPELRAEMGKKAKEYVISRYSIEKNAHLWEEAYASIQGRA